MLKCSDIRTSILTYRQGLNVLLSLHFAYPISKTKNGNCSQEPQSLSLSCSTSNFGRNSKCVTRNILTFESSCYIYIRIRIQTPYSCVYAFVLHSQTLHVNQCKMFLNPPIIISP